MRLCCNFPKQLCLLQYEQKLSGTVSKSQFSPFQITLTRLSHAWMSTFPPLLINSNCMLPTPEGLLAFLFFFLNILVSAFSFCHHQEQFFMKIWASQGDIPTSFPSSTVFVSSVGSALGSVQPWHQMRWYLVSQKKASVRLCLVCQFSPVAFLGTTVHIRRCLFMPVFCSNCKKSICFPPHTNISLICFHPSSCITALVTQQECLSHGPRFLPEGLFLQEFICECCNASKTLILWMCDVCAQSLSRMLQEF